MPGTFTFRPIQANLTHDTDWLGKMDPYCSYRVGTDRVKGPVCRNGGKFPKWEDATVNVPATNQPSIVVDLMDKDKILFDDNIGSFVIDLQEVQNMGQVSKWYPVYWRKKPAGEILLEAAYNPGMIQQPVTVVQEPVIIKETIIQEPVVVEKVVREEVIQPSTQTEYVSGPVIQGISQIHHGGEGHGLVPTHSTLVGQGSTIHQGGVAYGTHIRQGDYYEGQPLGQHQQGDIILGTSHIQHSSLNQGGIVHGTTGSNIQQGYGQLNQDSLHQGSLHQGSLNQGSLGQGQFNQGSLNQGSLNQGSLNQGSLGQGQFNQGALNQGEFNQGSLNQGQFNQGSLNQGNLEKKF